MCLAPMWPAFVLPKGGFEDSKEFGVADGARDGDVHIGRSSALGRAEQKVVASAEAYRD